MMRPGSVTHCARLIGLAVLLSTTIGCASQTISAKAPDSTGIAGQPHRKGQVSIFGD